MEEISSLDLFVIEGGDLLSSYLQYVALVYMLFVYYSLMLQTEVELAPVQFGLLRLDSQHQEPLPERYWVLISLLFEFSFAPQIILPVEL